MEYKNKQPNNNYLNKSQAETENSRPFLVWKSIFLTKKEVERLDQSKDHNTGAWAVSSLAC